MVTIFVFLSTVGVGSCDFIFFFFFQAEDGIRDLTVTGVQTCALPISKENAAVVPALVGAAWLLGFPRPPARRIAAYVIVWCLIGIDYALVRQAVFGPYPVSSGVAVVFLDQSPLMVRLTAVAALADGPRLPVFPLALPPDYSPKERTAVTGFGDPRLLSGL